MAAITAAMVKELREMTGAGMMDCKKALSETDGNMDEAVEVLRKSGAAKAEKKASRIAAEGICRIACDGNKAVVAEVNSETDFVAKNEVFQEFVQKVADSALASGLKGGKDGEDVEALLEKDGLKDLLVEKTAKIGEKLSVRRFERAEADCIATYIHGGGRIGVIVAAKTADTSDAVKEALTNIAMQVAALSPKFISQKDVDQAFLDHEKEIIKAQIENDPKEAAKPDKVKEGMVMGRINKEMKEYCLLDQVYVKAEDGKQSVAKYLESVNKDLVIENFIRFEVGEGMEKKNEDFAAEVAAQMNA
ncbi:MAG: elongation factor Ts [Lachnospiraceae bacterium]|nr:elongation factor Ts [Lachnospiraceae bacterium]MCR5267605.1 translation elongation factor Ts [Lachnospiraceae bacterium]